MRTRLQEMRKRAGFSSAKAFAEHIGMSVSTYTKYEQGVSEMTLERAWQFADALGCTLDEIAGRVVNGPDQEDAESQISYYFANLPDDAKDVLLQSAKLMGGAKREE